MSLSARVSVPTTVERLSSGRSASKEETILAYIRPNHDEMKEMDKIRSGAPQARPIPILLYTTLHLALGRAPPGPPGRPGCTACEEHCFHPYPDSRYSVSYLIQMINCSLLLLEESAWMKSGWTARNMLVICPRTPLGKSLRWSTVAVGPNYRARLLRLLPLTLREGTRQPTIRC
jgi:hypothetical protein